MAIKTFENRQQHNQRAHKCNHERGGDHGAAMALSASTLFAFEHAVTGRAVGVSSFAYSFFGVVLVKVDMVGVLLNVDSVIIFTVVVVLGD